MASRPMIAKLTGELSASFPSYRKSDDLTEILARELHPFSDDTLECAIRRLVTTAERSPTVRDILGAVRAIEAETGRREPQGPFYPDYWDRSPRERAEIDAARSECLRVMAGLANGVPVESLFPPDSEPVRLGRELAERRERWNNRDTATGAKASLASVADVARGLLEIDYKAKAAGERDEWDGRFDW